MQNQKENDFEDLPLGTSDDGWERHPANGSES